MCEEFTQEIGFAQNLTFGIGIGSGIISGAAFTISQGMRVVAAGATALEAGAGTATAGATAAGTIGASAVVGTVALVITGVAITMFAVESLTWTTTGVQLEIEKEILKQMRTEEAITSASTPVQFAFDRIYKNAQFQELI